MKTIVLATALISFFCGCEEVPGNNVQKPEVPTIIGTWETVKEYHTIKGVKEGKDVGIKEAKLSHLTLNENGTGSYDIEIIDGDKPIVCNFTWALSENDSPTLRMTNQETGLYVPYGPSTFEQISWRVDEFTADKLVLWGMWEVVVIPSESEDSNETHNLSYTFEKVE